MRTPGEARYYLKELGRRRGYVRRGRLRNTLVRFYWMEERVRIRSEPVARSGRSLQCVHPIESIEERGTRSIIVSIVWIYPRFIRHRWRYRVPGRKVHETESLKKGRRRSWRRWWRAVRRGSQRRVPRRWSYLSEYKELIGGGVYLQNAPRLNDYRDWYKVVRRGSGRRLLRPMRLRYRRRNQQVTIKQMGWIRRYAWRRGRRRSGRLVPPDRRTQRGRVFGRNLIRERSLRSYCRYRGNRNERNKGRM